MCFVQVALHVNQSDLPAAVRHWSPVKLPWAFRFVIHYISHLEPLDAANSMTFTSNMFVNASNDLFLVCRNSALHDGHLLSCAL
jgi:hypothetical protein